MKFNGVWSPTLLLLIVIAGIVYGWFSGQFQFNLFPNGIPF